MLMISIKDAFAILNAEKDKIWDNRRFGNDANRIFARIKDEIVKQSVEATVERKEENNDDN